MRMSRFARRIALAGALTAMSVLGLASSASASFHLMLISEVYPGTPAGQNGFMELQMYEPGQNQVVGQQVKVYNAAGNEISAYTIAPLNPPNAETQRTILIGDVNTPNRDFTYNGLGPALDAVRAGGAACFLGSGDCASFGNFTGAGLLPSPTGVPIIGGIPVGSSATRKITPNCATLLEAADDTNNSANDFTVGAPNPRSNVITPTERPCQPVTPTTKKKKKKCKKKRKKKGGASAAAKKKKKCKKKKK